MTSAKIVLVLKTFQLWTITSRPMPLVHMIKGCLIDSIIHVHVLDF